MVPMAEEEGGPEMVTLSELARRLVSDGVVDQMSHQRVSQLRRDDPEFPPVQQIGRAWVVDYRLARPYFTDRKARLRPGARTDLKPPPAAEE